MNAIQTGNTASSFVAGELTFLNRIAQHVLSVAFSCNFRQTCFILFRNEIRGGYYSSALPTKRRKYVVSIVADLAPDTSNRGIPHM